MFGIQLKKTLSPMGTGKEIYIFVKVGYYPLMPLAFASV